MAVARATMTTGWSPVALATKYAEIGQQLAARRGLLDTFAAVTDAAVRLVPGVELAGITRAWPDHFDTVAPSAPLVRIVDKIQYDLGSGPCVDAVRKGSVFRTGHLDWDTRWPDFGHRAYEAGGIRSMLSFRLYLDGEDEFKASLNLYSLRPEAFNETSEAIGLLLATHGAIALRAAAAADRAENLSLALARNRRIGVATGVLMATHKITEEQAFDLMRIASHNVNRKLRDVAEDVAITGALPLPKLSQSTRNKPIPPAGVAASP